MNNNIYPDMMYDAIQARHEDLRNAEAAHYLADSAQYTKIKRFKALVSNVMSFTKRAGSPATLIDTQEAKQASLRNRQT